MNKPKKWTEVYPHGTKAGDIESKFFKALARHPKYDWRSTGAIVKASGLPQETVEEIIDKYISMSPPLIYPHPKNDAHWGYWERVPDMLKDDNRDLSTKDKDNRIGKHLGTDVVTCFADDIFLIEDDVVADKIDLQQLASGASLVLGSYDALEVSCFSPVGFRTVEPKSGEIYGKP